MNACCDDAVATAAPSATDDSVRAWLAVLSVAAAAFVLVTTEFLPIGLLTPIADALHISAGQAGLAVTVPAATATVAALALTLLAGRLDRRHVLLGLTACIIAANMVAAMAPNLAVLLIGRVLVGIAVGGFWTFSIVVARRLVSEAHGVRATALVSAGIAIATVLSVPAGAMLGHWAGWLAAFAVAAAIGVIVLAAQWWLLPALPAGETTNLRSLLALLEVPSARIGLLATVLIAAAQFGSYTYLEPFLREVPRMDQATVTAVLLAYGVTGIVGSFLAERIIARGLSLAFGSATLLAGIVLLAVVWLGHDKLAAAVLVGLWGFAFSLIPVCIPTWMYRAAPEAFEGGSALMVVAFQISMSSGSWLGGRLVDATGVGSAFVLGGVLALAATAVIGLLGRRVPSMAPAA